MPSAISKNILGPMLVSIGLLATPAVAGGRTIVGDWAPDPSTCFPSAGAVNISPMSLVADEMSCSFKSVARTGDQVTWRGSCNFADRAVPAVVVATLQGERLSVRVNNQQTDTYRRCKR